MTRKEEKINIENIYIGCELKTIFLEELGTYEEIENLTMLEKQKYYLECETIKVELYKDLKSNNQIYLKNDGTVFHDYNNDDIEEHFIDLLFSLKDMICDYKDKKPQNPYFKNIVYPSYSNINNLIKNKKNINQSDFLKITEDIVNLYAYHITTLDITPVEEETEEEITIVYDLEKIRARKKDK